MNQTIIRSTLLLLSVMLMTSAQAASISLSPSTQTVQVGDTVIVSLTGDFSDIPVLGGGFDVFFDDTLLTFSSFSFDPALGDDPAFRRSPDVLENELNGFAFGDFNGIDGPVSIGQITFTAIANGVVNLTLAMNEGGIGPNPNGPFNPGPFVGTDGLVVSNLDFTGATVTVVPVPAALWLLLGALAGLGQFRRKS